MSATASTSLWWRKRRADHSDLSDDESASEDQLEDVNVVVGPNPSSAVRQIMTDQYRELVEGPGGLPTATEGFQTRAMQGPISGRRMVALSDCQILARLSEGGQPRSFGTALHLGENCTILCQVCSFSGSARACKKSWLCDFCHGLSLQCRNKRKGSGAWQVSQLSDQRIMELYKALQASQGSNAEGVIPAHPRTIAEPHTRRTWRTELRSPAAPRSHTWGGEGEGHFHPTRRTPQPAASSSFEPARPLNIRPNVKEGAWFPVSPNVQSSQMRQEMLMRMQQVQMRQQQAVQPQQLWNQIQMPTMAVPTGLPQNQSATWFQPDARNRWHQSLQQFQPEEPYTGGETIRFNL